MKAQRAQILLLLGFTAIFTGYLSVWLPGPGVGLTFLGIEMGEWLKFLGLGARRDIFYLPPITLGLMLAIWTITWHQNDWRAWGIRALAVLVSLLAFPAIADITGPVRGQYILRVILIGLVILVDLLSGLWRPLTRLAWIPWAVLALLGITGALLPTWMYLNVRVYAVQILGVPVGVGLGVWLNGVGHLLILAVSAVQIPITMRPSALST